MKDWCEDYSSSFTRIPLQRKTLFWIFIVLILTSLINEFFYYHKLIQKSLDGDRLTPSECLTGESVCIALYSYYFIDSQLWDKGVSLTLHMRGKCVSPHHNGQGAVRPDRRSKNMPLPGFQILIFQFQKWEFISCSQQSFLALGFQQHGQRSCIKLI